LLGVGGAKAVIERRRNERKRRRRREQAIVCQGRRGEKIAFGTEARIQRG
jgi:hypothetical protein